MTKSSLPPFSSMAQSITPGIYQHYKGNKYRVISIARHSETLEELVVYQALYGDYGTWVRPVQMWSELVTVDGVSIPRFQLIEQVGNSLT